MTNKFDAVKESRKWKEMVAAQTNGLATEEVIRYFDICDTFLCERI